MGEQASTAITGIRTVGVPVTDQDRAVAFYVDVLGLDKRFDAPVEQLGGRWIEVAPAGAATTIALVPAGPDAKPGVETGIRLTVADAAALHEKLVEHGVEVGELLRWPGVPPMFGLRDPDGNGLEVVE
ncbi:catechol 2,3-dioxygenase-like lactoylglutathione lyase family enzyme [Nonomuraea thailandensis]|uniref:Catechol 2,3-dioxygenase-like lactoylglutathione lyase family enzyme n=1 Tax=Nonomuraea thailandensis TaxID=1188745 RepID=A0A9X2K658_9ACTN|nr:VOC family protein [Nonomuraea thailandensis]MCP2361808.1 catechol 2,3-dioxygenase-like lactoylglutathione lyase family enzyme [Nonomuraea thailandensis]